jgi:hypothetical protein
MTTTLARGILAIVTIVSLFPIFALNGLLFSFALIGGGLLQATNGAPLKGGITSLVSVFAFCGVFTLCNLLLHFWRTPFRNPLGRSAKKYGVGLILGWVAMSAIWLGAIDKAREVQFGAFCLLPVAVVVSLLWLANMLRRQPHS